ncbi:MAG TPA: hypothetical protein DCS93_41845 [Microscillaceae bacterium]|nr:hypothetical protein [Microscillaceae bacterium]
MKFSFKEMVKPNRVGFLFIDHVFEKMLKPGVYKFPRFSNKDISVYTVSVLSRWIFVAGQEVLTQDNITLRISYDFSYKVTDFEAFRNQVDFLESGHNLTLGIENQIRSISQTVIRDIVAGVASTLLNDKRAALFENVGELLQERVKGYGITIEQVLLKDIFFPKKIQELFAQQLEANIRSKADLDKARTQVATARALKNAADLMRDNENIKFLKMMETLTELSAKGKHTFMIGSDFYQSSNKTK